MSEQQENQGQAGLEQAEAQGGKEAASAARRAPSPERAAAAAAAAERAAAAAAAAESAASSRAQGHLRAAQLLRTAHAFWGRPECGDRGV